MGLFLNPRFYKKAGFRTWTTNINTWITWGRPAVWKRRYGSKGRQGVGGEEGGGGVKERIRLNPLFLLFNCQIFRIKIFINLIVKPDICRFPVYCKLSSKQTDNKTNKYNLENNYQTWNVFYFQQFSLIERFPFFASSI